MTLSQSAIEYHRKNFANTATDPGQGPPMPCADEDASDTKIYLYCGASSSGSPMLLCEANCILLDEERLYQVAADMFGITKNTASSQFDLRHPREIPTTAMGVFLPPILGNYSRMFDALSARPEASAALELDTVFYKLIALLLSPESLWPGQNPHQSARLIRICAYIRAHLCEPIQLSDLEKNIGMSRRNLQYLFARELSCTPMQWIREERLMLANQKLLGAPPRTLVTDVALACGFDNLATFSAYFKKRFGLLPSQVLNNNRGKGAPRPLSGPSVTQRFGEARCSA